MKTPIITTDDFCGRPRLKVHLPEHRPSWKNYGDGWADIALTLEHSGALNVVASETPDTIRGAKEVMMTIPKEAVRKLAAMIAPADQKPGALDVELNRQLAREAGIGRDGVDWFKEYAYHLGAVVSPLPFEMFKLKRTRFDKALSSDPDGKKPGLDKTISTLSKELGY